MQCTGFEGNHNMPKLREIFDLPQRVGAGVLVQSDYSLTF
jgi:hypothetical protein